MDDQGLIYFFLLIESDRTKRKKTVHNDYEVGFMRLRLIATSPGTKPSTSPSPVVEPVSGLGWGFRLPSHRACTRTRAWLSTLDARAVLSRYVCGGCVGLERRKCGLLDGTSLLCRHTIWSEVYSVEDLCFEMLL